MREKSRSSGSWDSAPATRVLINSTLSPRKALGQLTLSSGVRPPELKSWLRHFIGGVALGQLLRYLVPLPLQWAH